VEQSADHRAGDAATIGFAEAFDQREDCACRERITRTLNAYNAVAVDA
jgi:hypothetical protein